MLSNIHCELNSKYITTTTTTTTTTAISILKHYSYFGFMLSIITV